MHLKKAVSIAVASSVLLTPLATSTSAQAQGRPKAALSSASDLQTAPAKGDIPSLTWWIGPYPPSSMDPVKYQDYPEDQIIPNMCDSLVIQTPGLKTVPDLAQSWSQPNPTTLTFNLHQGVKFWDGSPMTAADVVYSLKRNMNPANQSIYTFYFDDVKTITASGPLSVTVKFSKPDSMFLPEMASLASAVVEPKFVQQKGSSFGTPKGGIMCTGAYKLQSWNGTSDLVMVKNNAYWDKARQPKVGKITFQWPNDPGQIASAFDTGTFAGGFFIPGADTAPLKKASSGHLYSNNPSQSMQIFALIVVGTKGAISNQAVRQALSASIDRSAVIKVVQFGQATPAYAEGGSGYVRADPGAYQAAYNAIAKAGQDTSNARKLVAEAGSVAKKPIVLAIPGSNQQIADLGSIVQQSAASVGLNVKLKVVPADQYGALFSDAKARTGDDLIFTGNYDQVPDPLAIYDDIAMPGAISNFNNYDNPKVIKLLTEANATFNAQKRAPLVIQAQKLITQDLPWIPLSFAQNQTFVRKGICGVPLDFSAMTSPWAASIGKC